MNIVIFSMLSLTETRKNRYYSIIQFITPCLTKLHDQKISH